MFGTIIICFCCYRGRCTVIQLTDVKAAKRFVPVDSTYFTLLGYNPDTRRLATIQGEICIGSSHQVGIGSE